MSHYFPGDDLFTPATRPHGLPIGNLTSQIWANAMLTPVDHLIASRLGIGTFVRYCDDLLLYSQSQAELLAAWHAIQERCTALRLHPRKCRLHRTKEPVRFLGFVLRRTGKGVNVRLTSENVQGFRRRTARTLSLWEAGALDTEEVLSRVRAWLAHAAHGHTRTLCERELGRLCLSG